VFAAYPGLDIVHRVGIVHLNVDPLSRLPQIPPHQLPVEDKSPVLPSPLPAQPIFTWEDRVERKPEEWAAFLLTRAQTRKQGKKTHPAAPVVKEDGVPLRNRAMNPPGHKQLPHMLNISISPSWIEAFIKGYQEDPSFKQSWKEAAANESELLAAQWFYKSDEGLLIFHDADWVAWLCMLKSEVHWILKESHESPWESAHTGSSRLFHKLVARFYWPRMWADIIEFTKTCDVCQKTKPDKHGPIGKLCPHAIPLLPFKVVMLDLITGLLKLEGHDTVLVIIDKLTKFIQYIPTSPNLKQDGFAKLFIQNVVLKYGLPHQVITDQDTRWAKAFWASVAKHLDLDLLLSTSHHPQTDGQMEPMTCWK
jgi:Integrase zinc binding domain